MSIASFEIPLRRLTWVIAASCATVVLATASLVVSPRIRQVIGLDQVRSAYRAGEYVDVPSSTYDRAPYTVLLFARASCVACQQAAPVLSHLVASLADTKVGFRVLAPAKTQDQQTVYAKTLGLTDDQVVPTEFRSLRVRVVPTAVLVDRQGRILEAAEGGDGLETFTTGVLAYLEGR